jgi:hypothetical protein
MGLASTTADISKNQSNLSTVQQKQLMGANAANGIVDQIEQNVSQLGASGRVGGLLASIGGKAGLNPQVNAYEQQRPAFALMLIKAIQGSAGNISDADRNAINASVPSVRDTNQERQIKLSNLRQIISTYQNSAFANGGNENDLLAQLNGTGANYAAQY